MRQNKIEIKERSKIDLAQSVFLSLVETLNVRKQLVFLQQTHVQSYSSLSVNLATQGSSQHAHF